MTEAVGSTELLTVLREVLETDFAIEPENVVPNALLGDDLDFDSIDAIDLAHRLEDRLEVTIGDDGFDEIRSVADLLARVEQAVASSASSAGAEPA